MRTIACIALTCLIPTAVLAQNPTDKIKLEITRADLQVIGNALMEAPYKTAAPVMILLQQQLTAADQAAADAAKAEAEKKAAKEPAKK